MPIKGSKSLRTKKVANLIFQFLLLFNLIFLCEIATANCSSIKNNKPIQLLLKSGAVLAEAPQMDFGRHASTASCYLEAWPRNQAEVVNFVKLAYANHLPIRTQGASHSENGSSLPHQLELIIHTTKLNELAFNHRGRVTAGAGLSIALVKMLVEKYSSFFVPVANDGGIAPTIGGYISAGGISSSSVKYGGFWEHVDDITLVTGNGKVMIIKRHDPIFLYLFGSMGQLGIITQVTLSLLPAIDKNASYPLGEIAFIDYPMTNGHHWIKKDAIQALHWLNLFVPLRKQVEVKKALLLLQAKYPKALLYRPIYEWQVTYISIMPPLLFDKKESFVAVGIWGEFANNADSQKQFEELQHDFSLLVKKLNARRYIQTELVNSSDFYKSYFSDETFSAFKKIKSELDPAFLFNKGSVF